MEKTAFESEMEYIQISRIELGKINTTLYQVYKLAKAMDIEMAEFFVGIHDAIDKKLENFFPKKPLPPVINIFISIVIIF